jgi:hypothetical protein
MRCRRKVVTAGFEYTFAIGGTEPLEAQRRIEMEFDSTGVARSVVLSASRINDKGRAEVDAHVIVFHHSAPAISTMTTAVDSGTTSRDATAAELRQVKELAAWLWARRCAGS